MIVKAEFPLNCLLVAAFFTIAGSNLSAASANSPRERLLLDPGWKFHLGNEWGFAQNRAKAGTGSGPASRSFSDASWRTVNLPHDWAVELPFDQSADAGHGFKPVGPGFAANNVAWYRRTFELPEEDAGKRLWLEFDGVFRDCEVFVNGWFVGHHESGYSSFRYDITDVANPGGKNVVAVKVDASQFEGWFYEGAGIYRHVWLVKTAPLAIAPDGIFVYSQFKHNVPEGPAEIHIQTRLLNSQTNAANATVRCEIIAPNGKTIGDIQKSAKLSGRVKTGSAARSPAFASPNSGRPNHPNFTSSSPRLRAADKWLTARKPNSASAPSRSTSNKGFLLNGKPCELKGTCNHQDHAGVGAALPDGLQYFRVAKLKEMGCNAVSHLAQPAHAGIARCLRPPRHAGHGRKPAARQRRGKSAPLERPDPARPESSERCHLVPGQRGIPRARHARRQTRRPDDAEFCQATRSDAARAPTARRSATSFRASTRIIDVRGWNYHIGRATWTIITRSILTQPNVGTEQGSTVSTRGIYANDKIRGYVSAYDDNAPHWAHTAESGGVSSPRARGSPAVSSGRALIIAANRRLMAGRASIRISASWTPAVFPRTISIITRRGGRTTPSCICCRIGTGRAGKARTSMCAALSNCEEVELFLNGQSLGRKTMTKEFASGTGW